MEVHSTLFLFGGFDQITHTELGQDKGHFFKYINTEVIESLFNGCVSSSDLVCNPKSTPFCG